MVTAVDFFCGAGGSSTGLVVAGIEVTFAANHWKRAIETHSTNHPDTRHDIADLQQTHASRYPRADIAWFSPECKSHSLAKGKKRKTLNQLDLWGNNGVDPAEERSRATMREVVEFTEYHHYEIIIVENVVDIRHWQYYDLWLHSMINLGYEYKVLYLNAQFFGVPQSRDRFYAVFWKKGNKAPDLDFRPPAFCTHCEKEVFAVQSWKKEKQWGKFGRRNQYLYLCPVCSREVQPCITPAHTIIDWSLPAQKIGNRDKPLQPKTLQRIRAGLKKYARSLIVDTSFTHDDSDSKVRPVDAALNTLTTRQSHMFIHVEPFLTILKNSWSPDGKYTLPPRSLNEPLTTVVASASQHGLVIPPMALSYYNNETDPRSLDDPLYTIATTHTSPIILPPSLILSYYGRDNAQSGIGDPLPVIPTANRHSLVLLPEGQALPFVVSMRRNTQPTSVMEPISTVTAGAVQHALLEPVELSGDDIEVLLNESRYRMLSPEELKLGMSFPRNYVILGNQREQVKQVGHAVCCNVAQWIAERCVASLL